MKRMNYYLLMAAAVLGLSLSVTSCVDNIDNNGGKTPQEQEQVVQEKADKYWSVVSQLVSTDDYTPDYENKTFEPVYGFAQEGDPTTRLVYTNDAATAAERFADIVEVEGIDENTQTYTFDDPDIGTLTYTKGDEDGAIQATVDVNIKEIPSLKKILYVPGASSNGRFDGKAYYRFGDVVSRQTTDYDGNTVTEYWVCVRPAFGPEGKEESHWVCLNVLPKKNVYHYKGSNGTDYYLPTGLGTNKEHMQNLAEMLYAMSYPESWYQNVTQYAKDGLKMFHDFSADNIKYHNQYFWKNVQLTWKEKHVWEKVFNASYDDFSETFDIYGLLLFYNGYSWWTTTSWNCTLNVAMFMNDDMNVKEKNKHAARYDKRKVNMKDIVFDCRKMGPAKDNYVGFIEKSSSITQFAMHWAVRHATGKELCSNGRYDVKQRLNGCEEVYRYYRDVEPMDDLSDDPEVTPSSNMLINAPTDGRGSYVLGDVVVDSQNTRWYCISSSPWSPTTKDADHTAWFISHDFDNTGEFIDIAPDLPSEEELPEVAGRLMLWFITETMNNEYDEYRFMPGLTNGKVMDHVQKYTQANWDYMIHARDSIWTFNSGGKTYQSKSTSYFFNIAYRDSLTGGVAVARIIKDNTQAGTEQNNCYVMKDGEYVKYGAGSQLHIHKYYQSYVPEKMRQLTDDEKYLGMTTWCLPWMVTDKKMFIEDLSSREQNIQKIAKDDKWVWLPRHINGQTSAERGESREFLYNRTLQPSDFIQYYTPVWWKNASMYNEPVIFLRVMKVEDLGGKNPKNESIDGREFNRFYLQDDAKLYKESMSWLKNYPSSIKESVYLDNKLFPLPNIPGLK